MTIFFYEVQGVYDWQQVEAVSGELFYYGFYLTFYISTPTSMKLVQIT